ncbi:hypothetical protein AKJ37_03855 [candidate division MSBL1 archaeon SCGC-AAA259I09]|uniref:XdhC- CoxI domain-containing protein n=2 Tax=candidate division MSBL1 TaxID=215777 RepID=A0A133US62_9EURY|nr:hypothetical protein AKJ37_03855 [candidate division MSBL1 archaeon SCGC-AAA259I09]KXB05789.1 hypothetical protein AKJ51_04805 [candidate division MSBL1 archaeon SCGC-AAA382A20]
MINVFKKIEKLLEENKEFAVATVIRTEGSSPRKTGAKMIVHENGETFGTIGGGCAERAAKDVALLTLEEGKRAEKLELKLEEEADGGIGMKCGGKMEIFIEAFQKKC